MAYKPTPHDIEWTRNLINRMNDNGVWNIPRANSVWRFDKTNKVLVQTCGSPFEPDNEALRVIAPMLGYTTRLQIENKPQQITENDLGTGKTIERPRLPITEL